MIKYVQHTRIYLILIMRNSLFSIRNFSPFSETLTMQSYSHTVRFRILIKFCCLDYAYAIYLIYLTVGDAGLNEVNETRSNIIHTFSALCEYLHFRLCIKIGSLSHTRDYYLTEINIKAYCEKYRLYRIR